MKIAKMFLAVITVVFALALVAKAAQPVIYTLNVTTPIAPGATVTITNPVWTTQSGGQLTNLDVGLQSQFTLYTVAQSAGTNSAVSAGTNGQVSVSGLISPDGVVWTPTNAPAAFTLLQNSSNQVVAMSYSNLPATSWRFWGGILTIVNNSTNQAYGSAWTNTTGPSFFQLKSFWKAP